MHCSPPRIGRLCWKKALRREMNSCCESDGTPVLPAKISLCWLLFPGGSKRRQGAFGYGTYHRRVYDIRRIGNKIISTYQGDELYPGYTARYLRMYHNK